MHSATQSLRIRRKLNGTAWTRSERCHRATAGRIPDLLQSSEIARITAECGGPGRRLTPPIMDHPHLVQHDAEREPQRSAIRPFVRRRYTQKTLRTPSGGRANLAPMPVSKPSWETPRVIAWLLQGALASADLCSGSTPIGKRYVNKPH